MPWWMWLVITIIIIIFVSSLFSPEDVKNKSTLTSKSKKPIKSPQEISDEITTLAQLRNLERKIERLDTRRSEFQAYDEKSLAKEEALEKEFQILQSAYDIAINKTYKWQFIPNYDLDTPLSTLKNAYKTFNADEYHTKREEIGGTNGEWLNLTGDDEPEEKEPEFIFSLKFRKIVEDIELSESDKIKKINSLVSRNKDIAESYFDLESSLKPGVQWFTTNT